MKHFKAGELYFMRHILKLNLSTGRTFKMEIYWFCFTLWSKWWDFFLHMCKLIVASYNPVVTTMLHHNYHEIATFWKTWYMACRYDLYVLIPKPIGHKGLKLQFWSSTTFVVLGFDESENSDVCVFYNIWPKNARYHLPRNCVPSG